MEEKNKKINNIFSFNNRLFWTLISNIRPKFNNK